jgi:hypothetical protein
MEIFRHIRVVLVRHMIDIGRLSIQISMNRVHLHGSLCRLPGVTTELTPTILRTIFSELGMIRGIRRVDGDFDNWQQMDPLGVAWAPIQPKKIIASPLTLSSTGVIDIDDAEKPTPPEK